MASDALAAFSDIGKFSEHAEKAALERLATNSPAKVARTDIEFALGVVNQTNQLFSKQATEIRRRFEAGGSSTYTQCVERMARVALAAFRYLHEHRSKAGFNVLTLEKTLSNFLVACTNAHLGTRVWDGLMFLRSMLLEHARTHTAASTASISSNSQNAPTGAAAGGRSVRKPASRAKKGTANKPSTVRQPPRPKAGTAAAAANITRGMHRLSISTGVGTAEQIGETQFPIQHCQSGLAFNVLVVTMLCNILRVLAQAPSSDVALKSVADLAKRAHGALDWCLRVQQTDREAVEPFWGACFRAYYTLGGIDDQHALDIRLLAVHAYSQTKTCDTRELLKYASRTAMRAEPVLLAAGDETAAYGSIGAYYSRVLQLVQAQIESAPASPELVEFCHHVARTRLKLVDIRGSLAACRLISGSALAKLVSGLLMAECLALDMLKCDKAHPEATQACSDLSPLTSAALDAGARHTLAEWNALALCADISRKAAKGALSDMRQGRTTAASDSVSRTLVAMLEAASTIYTAYISRGAAAKAENSGGTSVAVLSNHSAEVSLMLIQIALQHRESDAECQSAADRHSDRLLSMCADGKCSADYLRNHSTVYFNRGASLYQLKIYAQAARAIELAIRSLSQWAAIAARKGVPLGGAFEQLCKRFEVAALAYQSDRSFLQAAGVYGQAVQWIVEHTAGEICEAVYLSGLNTRPRPPSSSLCQQSTQAAWLLQFVDRYVRMNAGRLARDPSEPQCLASVQVHMQSSVSDPTLRGWLFEAEAQFWRPFVTPTAKAALGVQESHLKQALDAYEGAAPVAYARCMVELAKAARDRGDIETCGDRLHAAMEVAKSQADEDTYTLCVLGESYAWQAVVRIESKGSAAEEIGACTQLWAIVARELASTDPAHAVDAGYMRDVVGVMHRVVELLMSRRLFTHSAELLRVSLRISTLCEHGDRSWAPVVMECLIALGSAALLCGDSAPARDYFNDAASRYESGVLPVHVEIAAKIAFASFQLACGDTDAGAVCMHEAGELARNSLDAVSGTRRGSMSKRRAAADPDTLVLLSKASHAYSRLALKQGELADSIDLGIHAYRILNSLLKSLSLAHQRAAQLEQQQQQKARDVQLEEEDDPFSDAPRAEPSDDSDEKEGDAEFVAFAGSWELQRLLVDVLAHLAEVFAIRGSTKEVEYFLHRALELSARLQAPLQSEYLRYIETDVLSRKSMWDECAQALHRLRDAASTDSVDDREPSGRGAADLISSLVIEGDSWRRCGNLGRARAAYAQATRAIERMSDAEIQRVVRPAETTPRLQRILSRADPGAAADRTDAAAVHAFDKNMPSSMSVVREDVALRQRLISALGELAGEVTGENVDHEAANASDDGPRASRSIEQQPEHMLLQCKLAFVELQRMLAREPTWEPVLRSTLMFPALQQPRTQKPRKGTAKALARTQLSELDAQLLETIRTAVSVGAAHTVHEASHLLALVRAMRAAFGLMTAAAELAGAGSAISNIIDDCRNITVAREVVDAARRRQERVPAGLSVWPEDIVKGADSSEHSNDRLEGSPVMRAQGTGTSGASLDGLEMLAPQMDGRETLASTAVCRAVDGAHVVSGWAADLSPSELAPMLPPEWTVCGLSVDQARDMLFVTRYQHAQEPIVLCLPMRAIAACDVLPELDIESRSVFDDAHQKLRAVIAESDRTMKTGGACSTEREKRAWWEHRAELDRQLGALLRSVEDEWLGAFRHVLDPNERFTANTAQGVDVRALCASIGRCVVQGLSKTFATKARALEPAAELCLLALCVLRRRRSAGDGGADEADNDWLDVCSLIWDTYFFQGAVPASDDNTLAAFAERLREAVCEIADAAKDSALAAATPSADTAAVARAHLVLVLDKHTQQIPWECLPSMREFPVTRVPSLAFLRERIVAMRTQQERPQSPDLLSSSMSHPLSAPSWGRVGSPIPTLNRSPLPLLSLDDIGPLSDTRTGSNAPPSNVHGIRVSGERVFYVLNPEGDLKRTQSNFEAFVRGQASWDGCVGRRPMNHECEHGLQSRDIFMYFGHGGAEAYVSRAQIRALDRCAVALLLGCSSGQLALRGEFDALGTATDYMVGGCPALVGNLWDVGDKDIDRFAASMLRLWGLDRHSSAEIAVRLDPDETTCGGQASAPVSLAEAVCWARKACRMSFLTGAAPVVYGIPVYLE
ncbi:separin protein [Coemansia sp. RSA 2618]|nr:separin protein [Coemansia sp. RSA 2618]